MNSERNTITESFGKSISVNIADPFIDTAEVVLDSFSDDEILKEIPILKYAVSAYKIVDDIRGRFFLRKLKQFINSFNSGLASEEEIEKHKAKFFGKNRDKELSYITIMIDRYLDFEKPDILAKLYLAYLDKRISWDEFCIYSEVIDKLLRNDLKYMIDNETYITKNNIVSPELLRLAGIGLMIDYHNDSLFESDGSGGFAVYSSSFDRVSSKERVFQKTSFGQKLVDIISGVNDVHI